VPHNPLVKQGKVKFAFGQRFYHEVEPRLAGDVEIEAVHEEKGVSRSKSHALVAVKKSVIVD
jgi:hypothetical protein